MAHRPDAAVIFQDAAARRKFARGRCGFLRKASIVAQWMERAKWRIAFLLPPEMRIDTSIAAVLEIGCAAVALLLLRRSMWIPRR